MGISGTGNKIKTEEEIQGESDYTILRHKQDRTYQLWNYNPVNHSFGQNRTGLGPEDVISPSSLKKVATE